MDAADTIQTRNSLETMPAHQPAATHAVIMEQVGQMPIHEEATANAKRLTAIAHCLTAYQQGLVTLKKLRQSGNQRIIVQYVDVSEGGQAAVVSNVEQVSSFSHDINTYRSAI